MGWKVEFNTKDAERGLNNLEREIDEWVMRSLGEMADALLLLSRAEVPHDTGNLQASGHTFREPDAWVTAYNTAYASYQHEGMRLDGSHVIKHWQKGRKGKFLEDPLKNNMTKWQQIAREGLSQKLQGSI